jgi:hypothetical protein
MNDELIKHMKIDDRLEAYRPFFDHSWAEELFDIATAAPKLADIVFDLTLSLKGLSNTAAIPLSAVDVAQAYAKGHNLGRLSNSLTLKLVSHLAARVCQKVVMPEGDAASLKTIMLDIAEEFYQKAEGKSVDFPRQELWDGFTKVVDGEEQETPKNEFRLGLWACQRICFSGVFFAYEDFLVRCVQTQIGKRVRSTDKDFNKSCDDTLGHKLTSNCWTDQDVKVAKLIRNSLAHAGGRETSDLQKVRHGIVVCDGSLQIMPEDVAKLFTLLKPRIKSITEWAATLGSFS